MCSENKECGVVQVSRMAGLLNVPLQVDVDDEIESGQEVPHPRVRATYGDDLLEIWVGLSRDEDGYYRLSLCIETAGEGLTPAQLWAWREHEENRDLIACLLRTQAEVDRSEDAWTATEVIEAIEYHESVGMQMQEQMQQAVAQMAGTEVPELPEA